MAWKTVGGNFQNGNVEAKDGHMDRQCPCIDVGVIRRRKKENIKKAIVNIILMQLYIKLQKQKQRT